LDWARLALPSRAGWLTTTGGATSRRAGWSRLNLLRLEFEKVMKRPRPADILLVVEVSDSTYRFDSTEKLRAYARNGIREYWIINLQDSCVEVYRCPQGERYTEQFKQSPGTMVSPLEFSDRSVAVADVLA